MMASDENSALREGEEMNKKELIQIVGGGVSPYSLINSLIVASKRQDSKLTPEQKAERAEKRHSLYEQRIRQEKIIKNICPDCEGKLIRGKKDKRNDYKRLWSCKDCGNSHSA